MANCPVHQKPFRPGKFGAYCATRMPDGSWCKEKPPAEEAGPAPVASPAAAVAPQVTAQDSSLEAAQMRLEAALKALEVARGVYMNPPEPDHLVMSAGIIYNCLLLPAMEGRPVAELDSDLKF